MKTILLTLLGTAAFAWSSSALADDSRRYNQPPMMGTCSEARATWNDEPVVIRTLGYPVVFLGRAGNSLLHSPQIVSETMRGDRVFLSKNGVFTKRETIALAGHRAKNR